METLGRDRAGVEEGLPAVGYRSGAAVAEVLVTDEHVRTVAPDEVRVVDVDAVGDKPDPHARAGIAERLRRVTGSALGRGVDGLDGLGVELDSPVRRAGAGGSREPALLGGGLDGRAHADQAVVDDLSHAGVGPQSGRFSG